MRFHPHGDASIGAALVGMGQRGWLVEPQGNFGNVLTGDEAAAPRYIEARLTPFAARGPLQPEDDHLAAQLRRTGEGARHPPGQVPDRAPRGSRGDRRRALDEDPAAQLQRPVPGGDQPPAGQDLPHLPGLSDRRHRGLLRVQRRRARRQGEGPRAGSSSGARCSSRSPSCPTGRRPSPSSSRSSPRTPRARSRSSAWTTTRPTRSRSSSTCPRAREPEKVIQQLYVFTACQVAISPVGLRDRGRQAGLPRRPRDPQAQRRPDRGAPEAGARDQAGRTRAAVALGLARAHLHRGAHLPADREVEDLGERALGDPRGPEAVRQEAAPRGRRRRHRPADRDPDQADLGLQPLRGGRDAEEDRGGA